MNNKNLSVLVFVLALMVSLIHIFFINKVVPIDDAAGYYQAAQAIADQVASGQFWANIENVNLPKNPLYILFVAGCLIVWNSLYSVLIAQAILLALTISMIFVLGTRLLNVKQSLLACVLLSIYTPLVVMTGLTLTETFSTFLLVVAIYYLYLSQTNFKLHQLIIIGASLCFLMYARSSFLPVAVVSLLTLIIFRWWKEKTLAASAIIALSFLGSLVPWIILDQNIKSDLYVTDGVFYVMWVANNPELDGWHVNYDYTGETLGKILKEKNKTKPSAEEYKKAVISFYREQPLKMFILAIKKSYYLLSNPANTYKHTFPIPEPVLSILHKAIVLFSLFYLFAQKNNIRSNLPFIVFAITNIGLYSITHVESRYSLQFMPFAALFAVPGFFLIFDKSRERMASLLSSKHKTGNMLAILAIIFISSKYIGVFPALVSYILHVCGIALLIYAILRFFIIANPSIYKLGLTILAGIFISYHFIFSLTDKNWHEWKQALSTSEVAVQEITFSEKLPLNNLSSAYIIMDTKKISATSYSFTVSLNGTLVYDQPRGPYTDSNLFVPDTYAYVKYAVLSHNPIDLHSIRQWYFIPVNPQMISDQEFISVAAQTVSDSPSPVMEFYGDHPFPGSNKYYEGPSYRSTSIYRWFFEDEYRLNERIRLSSANTVSYLANSRSPNKEKQQGNFRIRLLVNYKDGSQELY